jgi:hypothetical protein
MDYNERAAVRMCQKTSSICFLRKPSADFLFGAELGLSSAASKQPWMEPSDQNEWFSRSDSICVKKDFRLQYDCADI